MNEEQKQAVRDAVASALGHAYDCQRVWSAWGVGTMSSNDFSLVAEDDERLNDITDAALAAMPAPFQARVQPWMLECFGAEIAADAHERNHRFIEEALELVQACGATASEAHQLVAYVYGRPVGEKAQEVGGVMVTLAALCLAQDLDMHGAGEVELARIWTKVEQIRAKQAAKPKHSPLPEHVAAPQPSAKALDLIRLDFINSDGREDSKMITHDEMRGKYASARAGLAWVSRAGAALTDERIVDECHNFPTLVPVLADKATRAHLILAVRALLAAEQPSEDKRDD